jgi:hypothetical protein
LLCGGINILSLTFLSFAACIAKGIAPSLSCLMKALVVGNIHNISSVADLTIFRYRSCALAELGITSMSAKSTPTSISLILSVASAPFFHSSSKTESSG